jgi:hypothetical protein
VIEELLVVVSDEHKSLVVSEEQIVDEVLVVLAGR